MDTLSRSFTVLSALLLLVFEMVASVDAVPAALANAPLLDGRPAVVAVAPAPRWTPPDGGEVVWVRYRGAAGPRYGLLEGATVRELSSTLFEEPRPSGLVRPLSELTLLAPLASDDICGVLLATPGEIPASCGLEPIPVGRMLGPDDAWPPDSASGGAYRRAVIHVPGVGSRSRPRVGITAGLLLESPDGTRALASGPVLVVGRTVPESRIGPERVAELEAGTLVLELLGPEEAPERGRLTASLEGLAPLSVTVA